MDQFSILFNLLLIRKLSIETPHQYYHASLFVNFSLEISKLHSLTSLSCDCDLIKSGAITFTPLNPFTKAINLSLKLRQGDILPVLSLLPKTKIRHLRVWHFCTVTYKELELIYSFDRVSLEHAQNLGSLVEWGLAGRILPRESLFLKGFKVDSKQKLE